GHHHNSLAEENRGHAREASVMMCSSLLFSGSIVPAGVGRRKLPPRLLTIRWPSPDLSEVCGCSHDYRELLLARSRSPKASMPLRFMRPPSGLPYSRIQLNYFPLGRNRTLGAVLSFGRNG